MKVCVSLIVYVWVRLSFGLSLCLTFTFLLCYIACAFRFVVVLPSVRAVVMVWFLLLAAFRRCAFVCL